MVSYLQVRADSVDAVGNQFSGTGLVSCSGRGLTSWSLYTPFESRHYANVHIHGLWSLRKYLFR